LSLGVESGTRQIRREGAVSQAVDRDCRSHDHANLYGGAVIHRGSVNTTLTIAALALRLADRLKQA